MAPNDGSDRSDRDHDRSKDNQNPDKNDQDPFTHLRRSVDSLAASMFADLAEVFPSLQKHVPPPGTSFFDEMTREAFKRFNDSYERGMNPERKKIERYSYADKSADSSQQPQQRQWSFWGDPRHENATTSAQRQAKEREMQIETQAFGILAPFQGLFFGNDQAQNTWRPSSRYLTESPYSPCNLERDQPATQGHWRSAFEDLLRIEHGQPMTFQAGQSYSHERYSRQSGMPAMMWIKHLAQRGVVEDQGTYPFLLRLFGFVGQPSWQVVQARLRNPWLQSDFSAAEQLFWNLPDYASEQDVANAQAKAGVIVSTSQQLARSELDIYERWLRDAEEYNEPLLGHLKLSPIEQDEEQDQRKSSNHSSHSSSPQSGSSSENNESSPTEDGRFPAGVAHTTTTTRRWVTEDGGIITHTNFLREFDDGRVEVDESTTREPPKPDTRPWGAARGPKDQHHDEQKNHQQHDEQKKQQQHPKQKEKQKEKTGWFWK